MSQIAPHDFLGAGSDVDEPVTVMMCRLVCRWLEDPSLAGGVEVAPSQSTNLSWPHASESLQLDHVTQRARQTGQCGLDHVIRYWLDRRVVWSVGSPSLEAQDGLEAPVCLHGNKLILCRPPKKALDAAHMLVDL